MIPFIEFGIFYLAIELVIGILMIITIFNAFEGVFKFGNKGVRIFGVFTLVLTGFVMYYLINYSIRYCNAFSKNPILANAVTNELLSNPLFMFLLGISIPMWIFFIIIGNIVRREKLREIEDRIIKEIREGKLEN